MIEPGEIIHTHVNDTPRERLDLLTLVAPGDGVAPLAKILRKLVQRGYAGPISVATFLPKYQQADPFSLAKEIKVNSEAMSEQVRA